jgi:ATP-dependent DNA helicase 2 subunit 1
VLRNEEIGHAFQFGNESSVRNILERNWWESDEQKLENQMIADEVLKRDEERRKRRDEGEGDEEMQEPAATTRPAVEETKPKVVAKTRVSPFDMD